MFKNECSLLELMVDKEEEERMSKCQRIGF